MSRVSFNLLLWPKGHDEAGDKSNYDRNVENDIRYRAGADANRDRIDSNAGPQNANP
jgi:hypothetical protein